MNSFVVVVIDPMVDCFDEFLDRYVRIWSIKLKLELSIVGFSSSIFPGRSFPTHRYLNSKTGEIIHDEKTSVLTSLV